MDVKEIFLSIGLFLVVWFALGFIAFLIEAKRLKCYKTFDKTAQQDFIVITGLGFISFVIEIILVVIEWFINAMNKILKKINQ